jgi:ABC-type uncharacterized transport system substrate-binding protein
MNRANPSMTRSVPRPAPSRYVRWRFVCALLAALALSSFTVQPAAAHPHVWVTVKSQLIYDADGSIVAVRHAWTFDDMFSTFAVQGLESKKKGVFTREELQPLAEVNVTSLKEYDYFNHARIDGKKAAFLDPKDYFLEHKDALLVLHFTLPLKAPMKARTVDLEVYDPSYFVDFAFDDKAKDVVVLQNAPAQCKASLSKPKGEPTPPPMRLGDPKLELALPDNWGAQFANKISVKC